jgi:hypothetical protein
MTHLELKMGQKMQYMHICINYKQKMEHGSYVKRNTNTQTLMEKRLRKLLMRQTDHLQQLEAKTDQAIHIHNIVNIFLFFMYWYKKCLLNSVLL